MTEKPALELSMVLPEASGERDAGTSWHKRLAPGSASSPGSASPSITA